MSHKCLRCGNVFSDHDGTILQGCTGCGSRFFLYVKSVSDARNIEEKIEEINKDLEKKDTTLEEEIEKKIEEEKQKLESPEQELVEQEAEIPKAKHAKPRARERIIKFGVETVRIPKEGVYEINIDALMKKRPLIILERGKIYLIHLESAFEEVRKKL